MGNPSLSEPQNRQERRDNRPTEPSYTGLSEQGGQHQAERLHRQQRSQTLMRSSEQGCTDLAEWQLNGSDGVLIDDRIRKALTEALEQAQAQQQQREADLLKMFESTKQDNQSVREAFKKLLENISETDQTRNESLNKLARQVSNLSFQVQDFKIQNKALIEQLQALEMQVSKLKK